VADHACPSDAKRGSDYVCRTAVDEQCDAIESCDGINNDCPEDVFEPDGESCDLDENACTGDKCMAKVCVADSTPPSCASATSADQIECICPCGSYGPGERVSAGKNHGHYVSCVACVTNSLKARGIITGTEKGVIESEAGQSSCVMTKTQKQAVCQGNTCN
jgi:hypothetical protein